MTQPAGCEDLNFIGAARPQKPVRSRHVDTVKSTLMRTIRLYLIHGPWQYSTQSCGAWTRTWQASETPKFAVSLKTIPGKPTLTDGFKEETSVSFPFLNQTHCWLTRLFCLEKMSLINPEAKCRHVGEREIMIGSDLFLKLEKLYWKIPSHQNKILWSQELPN